MNNSYNKYRLPKAAYGDYLTENSSKETGDKDAEWAARIRKGLGPEYANYNDEQIKKLYGQGNIMTSFGEDSYVAPDLKEVTITSETDKERKDAYSARAAKYFREHPNDAMNDFLQTVGDYTISPIIDGVSYIVNNPSETFKSTTGTLGSDITSIRGLSRGMGSLLRGEEVSQKDKDILKSWSHRADEDKTGLASVKDIWGNEAYSNMEGINHLVNVLPAAGGVKPVSKIANTLIPKIIKNYAKDISKGAVKKLKKSSTGDLYHGSPHYFEKFDASKIGSTNDKGNPMGTFLTDDFANAKYFSKETGSGTGNLLNMFGLGNLKGYKPTVYKGKLPSNVKTKKIDFNGKTSSEALDKNKEILAAWDEGYDAIELKNIKDGNQVPSNVTVVKDVEALNSFSPMTKGAKGTLNKADNKPLMKQYDELGNYDRRSEMQKLYDSDEAWDKWGETFLDDAIVQKNYDILSTPTAKTKLKKLGVEDHDDFMKWVRKSPVTTEPNETSLRQWNGATIDTPADYNININPLDLNKGSAHLKKDLTHETGHLIQRYLQQKGFPTTTSLDDLSKNLSSHSNLTDLEKAAIKGWEDKSIQETMWNANNNAMLHKYPNVEHTGKHVANSLSKEQKTKLENFLYFMKGSDGMEGLPHLREAKSNMISDGIINSFDDLVTPEHISKFRKTSPDSRILSFTKNDKGGNSFVSKLLTETPILAGAVGTGIGLSLSGAASQKAYGGEISTNNNRLNNNIMLKKANNGMNIPQNPGMGMPGMGMGFGNSALSQAQAIWQQQQANAAPIANNFDARSEYMADGGSIPSGFHMMPDGTMMPGNKHKYKHGGPLETGNPMMDFINNNPEEAQRLLAKQKYRESIPKGNYTVQSTYDGNLNSAGEYLDPTTREGGKPYKTIKDYGKDIVGKFTGENTNNKTQKTDNIEGLGILEAGGIIPEQTGKERRQENRYNRREARGERREARHGRRGLSMEELYNDAMEYNNSGEDTYIKSYSADKNWRNKAKNVNMEFGTRPQENNSPQAGDIISQSTPFQSPSTIWPEMQAGSSYSSTPSFNYGGKPLPKANLGAAMTGIGDFLGSEQGGAVLGAAATLAPMIGSMFNKKPSEADSAPIPKGPMLDAYGNPMTNNPYANMPRRPQAPTYGGFTMGGMNGKQAEAMGMPNYGRQFAYGGSLPEYGFGSKMRDSLNRAGDKVKGSLSGVGEKLHDAGRTVLDATTETIGSGMKVLDPFNIGYGTSLSRGMGNLVGEDRYQKGWDQFTDGTQAFTGGAVKGALGVIPGVGGLAKQGLNSLDGIADKSLSNDDYGMLYKGQDKLKQTVGGVGEMGGAVAGGIFTGNVGGAVGSGLEGFNSFSQGMDMNNDWEGAQRNGGWSTAGNVAGGLSSLAGFIPGGNGSGFTGAMGGMFNNGGRLPSYGGGGIGLPGYEGDRLAAEAAAAQAAVLPVTPKAAPTSMYDPQAGGYKHGMGQNLRGFGPGNQMAYGEMFAKGGVLPSFHNGGEGEGHPHEDTVYSRMNRSETQKADPSYWGTMGSFSNNEDGETTFEREMKEMDISGEDYLAMDEQRKALEIEQNKLRAYYDEQAYNSEDGIPVDKVNELSPTYYDQMTAYQNALKDKAGIDNTNLAGNKEGNQIPYNEQKFGFRHNSYRPSLHAAEKYKASDANVSEYADINVDRGQRRYTKDGSTEKVYDNQDQLLRNQEVPTDRGLQSDAMMFYGNNGPIGVHMDESGRKYLQGEDGSNLGYFGEDFARGGYTNRYADGGHTQGQHPASQYIAEKDEMVYHPNDKPLTLANGGLNQVANNYSKITGDKHSAPSGGVEMAGGKDGYIYSDQLKVPKDLYNSLKGLI